MKDIERRIEKLEEKANIDNEEVIIIKVVDYSRRQYPEPSEEEIEKLIAEARAKGEKFVVIPVPYKPEKANLGE